ncbi:MAG: cell division protein FtsA [Tannerella sp.]|jgi:cell division protein FtsA|nr:cell division protein FtsA [Tannerella sp.]
MANTNYIVAIDLGTSHLVGMVGKKNEEGKLSILAEEIEGSASCIRRGCIFNVNDTAHRINRLIQKLQNRISGKLPNFTINKVYIGIGGQSLHSIDHFEVKTISTNIAVSEQDIKELDEQCRSYKPEGMDVLDISSPTYYDNGKIVDHPVGVFCKRLEARYKLIVGQPSIRIYLTSCFELIADIQLAGIIVSPLSLADSMLSSDEKELGCTCIDFGAGTTSVVVFKRNKLVHLCVIPLGGDLITKDLTRFFPFVESEAERIKITYGSAIMNYDKANPGLTDVKDGIGQRDVNTVVEARILEIVENVNAQIKSTGVTDQMGAGVVLAGGAAELKNLRELLQERLKQEVNFSTIRSEWMENDDDRMGNPLYMTAISLLISGTDRCVSQAQSSTSDKKPPTKKGNIFGKIFDEILNQS